MNQIIGHHAEAKTKGKAEVASQMIALLVLNNTLLRFVATLI